MRNNILDIAPTLSYVTHQIDNVTATMFKGDFRGLLLLHFNVSENEVEANIIINDLLSSTDYEGHKTTIKIIKSSELALYS